MRPLDALVIGLYLVAMLALGLGLRRRQTSLEEYFLASRSLGWRLIGLSLLSTSISTISYLSLPGEMVAHGPTFLFSTLVFPLSYAVIAYGLLPAYFRQGARTIFEYLRARFDARVELAGVVIFFFMRTVWMALIVYTAAIGLRGLVRLPTTAVILCVGLVATVYTAIGGIRADIISDAVQAVVMFAGAIVALTLVLVDLGGASPVLDVLTREGHLEVPAIAFGRTSLVGVLIWATFLNVTVLGTDQVIVQRYFCSRSLSDARRGLLFTLLATVAFTFLLSAVGLGLFAYYSGPEGAALAAGPGGLKVNADELFPHFIANAMPAGLAGLVIAALLAAAMSSLDSGINSSVTVLEVDLRERFGLLPARPALVLARRGSLVVGVAVTLLALLVPQLEGNLLQVSGKLGSWLEGALAGVFLLGVFSRRATPTGALGGAVTGVLTGAVFSYSDLLFGTPAASFTWIVPVSLAVTFLTGLGLSASRRAAAVPGSPPP